MPVAAVHDVTYFPTTLKGRLEGEIRHSPHGLSSYHMSPMPGLSAGPSSVCRGGQEAGFQATQDVTPPDLHPRQSALSSYPQRCALAPASGWGPLQAPIQS